MHHALFIIHHALWMTHDWLFITHYSLVIVHYALCITHHASCIMHHASCIMHSSLFNIHHALFKCMIHQSIFILHSSFFILQKALLILHHVHSIQSGVASQDVWSLQVIFRKKALWFVALLLKITCNLRHPVGLRHPCMRPDSIQSPHEAFQKRVCRKPIFIAYSLFCMHCV